MPQAMALIRSHLCLFLYMSLHPHNQDLFKYPSLLNIEFSSELVIEQEFQTLWAVVL